ncbi:hypothetical protein [Xanthomonas fragariae]|uniref:hypothetical protein n=1 Tax=Xanthomonas fragariae TaxID=48664 RepID=UPI0022AB1624|nr:hypothetical protein [Xanthomonas fragariae]WAT15912.1 hypothetical protein OZ429_06075 [Xanthomonas fragariae]
MGNTQTFVSKCERGEGRIDAVELVEFAEALGVPPLGLLTEYLERRRQHPSAKAHKGKKEGSRALTVRARTVFGRIP